MAISDIYTARSGSVATALTSAVPLLTLVASTTTKRLWIVGVRVEIGLTTVTAGNFSLMQLARPGNTHTATSLTSGSAHDFAAPASLGNQSTTWSTAPTVGTILWEQTLPQTTGSAWEEFPPLGYEWGVPAIVTAGANSGVHAFVTQSGATSTPYFVDLIWSE